MNSLLFIVCENAIGILNKLGGQSSAHLLSQQNKNFIMILCFNRIRLIRR